MKRFRLHSLLVSSAFVLSGVSCFVVLQNASDEPYTAFRSSEAIVQIGVAMMLMLLWLQLAAATVAGVARRHVSAWWLPLLAWVLICEFYLFHSLSGYVQDITRFVAASP
jgi:hypothetical protein